MKGHRLYSLDFLKIAATILILFHHYQQTLGVRFDGINFYGGDFYFGWVVEFFFLLSGFFMVKYVDMICSGTSFLDFFKKRFIRLFPMLAISSVAYEIIYKVYLVYSGELTNDHLSLFGTLITASGLNIGWCFSYIEVNGPMWYVSVLLLCYAEFYYVTWLSKRLEADPYILYVLVIMIGIGVCTYEINLPFFNMYSARGQYSFFYGLLFGRFALRHLLESEKSNWKLQLLCLCTVGILSYLIATNDALVSYEIKYILVFLYYPALIILFLSRPMCRLFDNLVIRELGQISFDVFVFHSPLLLLVLYLYAKTNYAFRIEQYRIMFLITIVFFLVGTVFHYCLELPINKAIQSAQRRKTQTER